MVEGRGRLFRLLATTAVGLLFVRPCTAPPAQQSSAGECYLDVAKGRLALINCTPDAVKLLEAVADVSSSLASGSLAEVWLRMGTRLHDLVTSSPEAQLGSPSEYATSLGCNAAGAAAGWEPILTYSRRCILTAMRLLVDSREAPQPGTHAGLSMGRALMHPCAIPSSSAPPAASGSNSRSYLGKKPACLKLEQRLLPAIRVSFVQSVKLDVE
jgi:hypothetical protein